MAINCVALSGRLTRDPEARVTRSGTPVLAFSLAVNDRRRDPQTGEWEDVPNFVDCVMFGARADRLSQMLRKGQKVAVSGRLHWESWERDGERRSKLYVYADEVELPPRDGAPAAREGVVA